MIRHVVLFKFKEGVTPEETEALAQELRNLRNNVGEVRTMEVTMDVGKKHNSYDMVLNALFDNMEGVEAYAVHPAHVKALDSVSNVCESTVKVDFHTFDVPM